MTIGLTLVNKPFRSAREYEHIGTSIMMLFYVDWWSYYADCRFAGSSGRGLGKSPSGVLEAKHDVYFALRITLVNEYCPFYSSLLINYYHHEIASHIVTFNLYRTRLPPPLCSHFSSDLRESQWRNYRRQMEALPPGPSPARGADLGPIFNQ